MSQRIYGTAPRPPLTPPRPRGEHVERARAAVERECDAVARERAGAPAWVALLAFFNLAVAVLAIALTYWGTT